MLADGAARGGACEMEGMGCVCMSVSIVGIGAVAGGAGGGRGECSEGVCCEDAAGGSGSADVCLRSRPNSSLPAAGTADGPRTGLRVRYGWPSLGGVNGWRPFLFGLRDRLRGSRPDGEPHLSLLLSARWCSRSSHRPRPRPPRNPPRPLLSFLKSARGGGPLGSPRGSPRRGSWCSLPCGGPPSLLLSYGGCGGLPAAGALLSSRYGRDCDGPPNGGTAATGIAFALAFAGAVDGTMDTGGTGCVGTGSPVLATRFNCCNSASCFASSGGPPDAAEAAVFGAAWLLSHQSTE